MQTSPVLTQSNLQATPSPTKAPADPSGTPFNQVLSREISDRGNADQSGSQPAPTNTAASHPAESANNTNSASAAKGKDAKKTDDKPDDDGKAADTSTDSVHAPADMLALVVNLNAARPDAKDAAGTTGATAAGIRLDTSGAGLAAAAGGASGAGTGKGKQIADLRDTLQAAANQGETRTGVRPGTDPGKDAALAAASDLTAGSSKAPDDAAIALPSKTDFGTELKDAAAGPALALSQAVQHAAALPLQNGASAGDKLTPPVGTPAWDQALGQKVVWMVAGDQQSASLTLNPPDLGPLQVVLNVHNATAHASFTAAQPEVRQALEAALPKLREMLGGAGIQLGQASVNSGSAHQQAPERQPSATRQATGRAGGIEATPSRVTRIAGGNSGLGLVDTFV